MKLVSAVICFFQKIPCEVMKSPLAAIGAFSGLAALFLAWIIPQRIMLNQMYSDMLKEYRSPEMGAAIHAIFGFYAYDCENDYTRIPAEYKKRYDNEKNGEPAKTLHFQRRLVSQFYYDMARLRFEPKFFRLSKKQMKSWFTESEPKLLSILLLMAEPARIAAFAEVYNVPDPPDDEVVMNQLIKRLYGETEDWV